MSQAEKVSRIFLAALFSATAMGPMAMQLPVPSIPAIAKDFDVPIGIASRNISISAVTIAISTLFYGPLSDRFGRRPVLLAGIVLFIVGTIVAALATTLELLIVGRVIQAIGGAAGLVIARAIVRDVYGPERAASVIGTLTVAMVAAPMIAVILGGVLTDAFGWRSIFIFALIVSVPASVLVISSLTETRSGPRPSGSAVGEMLRGYGQLFRVPAFNGFVFQGAFATGSFFSFMVAGPHLMVEVLGRPATEFGVFFAIVTFVFMAANYLGGRLSARVGIERMVLIGALWSATFSVVGVIWLAASGLGVFMLFATSALVSIGNGLAMPNTQAGALNIIPQYAGTASGAAAFMQTMLGAIVAQIVGSILSDSANPLFGAILFTALIALVFATLPSIFRHRPVVGEAAPATASEQSFPAE